MMDDSFVDTILLLASSSSTSNSSTFVVASYFTDFILRMLNIICEIR